MSSTQEVGNIFGDGAGPANAMMRSPTVLIAAVGLWGMNVFFFRLFNIDYVKVLKYDLILLDGPDAVADSPHHHHRGKKDKEEIEMPSASTAAENNNNSSSNAVCASPSDHKATVPSASMDYLSEDEDFMDDDLDDSNHGVEPNKAITWGRLVFLSMSLLFMLHVSYFWWIDVMYGGSIGAVFTFYGAVVASIMIPLPSTLWLRRATVIVLQRAFELINPRCSCVMMGDPKIGPRPIPFVDVFFADAMCSLSKVFFDWGMLWQMAFYYPEPVPQSTHNILVPSACAAVPFLIRARQCLIMYTVGRLKNDSNRFSHLWNALKYSTSIFPLCVSAYQKTLPANRAHNLDVYLIILLAINALYALYWDIVMDWGMMKNPAAASAVVCTATTASVYHNVPTEHLASSRRPPTCAQALLRSRLRFGVCMSAIILVTDAVLRFSWTLRFCSSLFPSNDSFVLCTQFLEIFRRAIWNLLRVEWENIKHMKQARGPSVVVAPPHHRASAAGNDEEMTGFLPGHNATTAKRATA